MNEDASKPVNAVASTDSRIETERDFHNQRFTQEVRESTHGYYRTVARAFRRYEEKKTQNARGKDVLEYGCGTGGNAIALAPICKSIQGIDLSDFAIEKARLSAEIAGYKNAFFIAGNAEEMPFEDNRFDFVFGSSILHHLVLKHAYREIFRVLKPGGSAVFLEPLGHNVLINRYRSRTPDLRTPDEHPLLRGDFTVAKKFFDQIDYELFGISTLAVIPFIKTRLAAPMLQLTEIADRVLVRIPILKWNAWFSVVELSKFPKVTER